MELVIKIPKKTVNEIRDNAMFAGSIPSDILWDISRAIVNGKPLPKGHGRLGDLSKIYDRLNDAQIEGTIEYKGLGEAKQIICDAPTIIEADKGER